MPDRPDKPASQSDLLARWKQRKQPGPKGMLERPEGAAVPATAGQRRLWLLQQLEPESAFYQYGHRYRFTGALDADALMNSIRRAVSRHEVFRSRFEEVDGTVYLRTEEALEIPILREDFSGRMAKKEASEWADTFVRRTFDLEVGPLMRVALLKIGVGEHWVLLSIHHIIGDRPSLLVLNEEIFSDYGQAGAATSEQPTGIQFADYAHWKSSREVPTAGFDYWTKALMGTPPLTTFPTDRRRPTEPTFAGRTISAALSGNTSEQVRTLARQVGSSPNVILLAAFQLLLRRYTGADDLPVGTPISIRDRRELEGMFGFLNETVVIRGRVDSNSPTFRAYAGQVKTTMEAALRHRDVPFDELLHRLEVTRTPGANPVFQNMFVYNAATTAAKLPGELIVSEDVMDLGVSKFDTTLFATDEGGRFMLRLEYAQQLYDDPTAERLLDNLIALVTNAVSHPERPLDDLRSLGGKELSLRAAWPAPTAAPPEETTLLPVIHRQLIGRHTQPAVTAADGTLTYAELRARSNELSHALLAKGVSRGDYVGLSCGRSVDLLVGILGILRAGAAYVPLDPAYPAERLRYIVEDARIDVLVGQAGERQIPVATEFVEIPKSGGDDDDLPLDVESKDPAYLIYTSGSTGRPKGVAIKHGNLLHSTSVREGWFGHQPGAFLLLSSYSFDSSVAGIFWTLSQGGHLVIPPERSEQDMEGLSGLIEQHGITHTLLLPSLYQLLLEHARPARLRSLRTVMVAGEACSPRTVATHYGQLPHTELVNEYGPTEGTVWCTAHAVLREDAAGLVPIGRPIPNVRNYLLSEALQPVPIGTPGELYLAGPGLAEGYFERPELTAERFITIPKTGTAEDPLPTVSHTYPQAGERLYRTGDLASFRPDGLIDFLGRADRQVKIRGHRVEPDELTFVLEAFPEIGEAATIIDVREGTQPALRSWYVTDEATDRKALTDQLLLRLRTKLPAYLVPSSLTPVGLLPRLPNGKIDAAALKELASRTDMASPSYRPATTQTGRTLADIWLKVLRLERVGLGDNFFSAGGDSLSSIRVMAAARKAGIELRPTDLFRFQTLGELAGAVEDRRAGALKASDLGDSIVELNEGEVGTSPLFCVHSGGGHVFFYQPLAAALPGSRPVYAIQPSTLATGKELPESIEEMAEDYLKLIRHVQPHGPYHLLGTCFSNVVVMEMAHRLRADGEQIGRLIFVDSGPTTLERQPEVRNPAIVNAVDILRKGKWKKLRRALYRRWFYVRQALGATVETEEQRTVRLTTNALYALYFKYDWEAIAAPVTLVRSTEFAGRADKRFHISQWNKLASDGLDVRVTPGTHLNLFADPQAKGLAKEIEACLTDTTSV